MPYDTRHVMNSILQRSFREGRSDMSPMKAQKMLFYVHGWHLATTGKPAIDRPFEAWKFGPVVTAIYHDLKQYGWHNITGYIPDPFAGKPFVVNQNCVDIYRSIDIAWEKYIGISAESLSAMTHEPGSPWDKVMKARGGGPIPDEEVRDYFVRIARA